MQLKSCNSAETTVYYRIIDTLEFDSKNEFTSNYKRLNLIHYI